MDQKEIIRRPIYQWTGLLIVLVGLFLVVRVSLLVFGPSHVFHPAFDETASGVLTCDILDGKISAPFMAYQYEARSGDSLLEALLLVPLFGLAGRSVFVLKILCIFSAASSLLLWLVFLKRYFGLSVALIFAAFFIFPPLTFARLNLLGTVASHHLVNPLIALQLIIVFRIFESGSYAQKIGLWFLAGVVAGFGSYLFYTYFIFNAFCALFLIFRGRALINLKRLICLAGGFLIGFSPWVYRLRYSTRGSDYLSGILKNLAIDPWRFVQNFGFNLAHSMGYEYPLRSIGLQSFGFTLLLLVIAVFLLVQCYKRRSALTDVSDNASIAPLLASGFLAAYPVFFLVCLSLSPMKINPFEYWPRTGLFGNFGASDLYRYRWLHSLYPFYLAVIAAGSCVFISGRNRGSFARGFLYAVPAFFVLCGLVKIVTLCSLDNAGHLIHYKGYNYERLVNRFLLRDPGLNREPLSYFPEVSRPEVYRCLGVQDASRTLAGTASMDTMEMFLDAAPLDIQNDYIYGVVNAGQNVLEQGIPAGFLGVAERYPDIFYEKWGQRYLGYRYFGVLCNQSKFLDKIGPVETWFFKREVTALFEEMNSNKDDFFGELQGLAIAEKSAAIKGVGMLVGSEMLFDPLHSLDYPLDSRFANALEPSLRKKFYEGVGAGFAETLCRFWRRILPSQGGFRTGSFDFEWHRCISLLTMMPSDVQSMVYDGFYEELQQREPGKNIRVFLEEKLK